MVNRLDTGLLVLPAVTLEAWHLRWRSLRPLCLGLLPLATWEIFSLIYYGFPVPNTVYAKLPPNLGLRDLLPHGLLYFQDSLTQDPATLPVIAAAILGPLLIGPRRLWPLSFGLALSLLFVLRVGGDFMSGRFFASPFVMAVAVLARIGEPDRRLGPVVVGRCRVSAGLDVAEIPRSWPTGPSRDASSLPPASPMRGGGTTRTRDCSGTRTRTRRFRHAGRTTSSGLSPVA